MNDKSRKDKDNLNDKEIKGEENLGGFVRIKEKKLRSPETERPLLDPERLRLDQELNSLRNEIDRLREPPLGTGVIVSVDEEKGRAIIVSSTGSMFVVNLSRKVRNQKLENGMFVGLNQRTYAVMEILSITKEELRSAKSKINEEN